MLHFFDLNPDLLNPVGDPLVFNAILGAHGTYTTEHFVLRLSPRVHELVDALTRGERDSYDSAELLQAYSTYLHETIHWWQHVGSSAGLILSLAYPAQVYGSMEFLQAFSQMIGGVKPVKAWAHQAMLNGKTHHDPALAVANIAVNNALDIGFYKQLVWSPAVVSELECSTYFESVGHSYLIAYGNVVFAINGSCDFDDAQFPNPSHWEQEILRLQTEQCEGFHHGSRPPVAAVGIREIFEGQARFSQIQFLASSGGPELLQTYREQGYFTRLYARAFEEFLRLTGSTWPDRYDSPIVALFLLICDLAINPTRGFPLDIESFENFIRDVDPGARFSRLCLAAGEAPELGKVVQDFSAIEYEYVASYLTERCGYDDPRTGLDSVIELLGDEGPVDKLMEEYRTFDYGRTNMPVRVLVSHYIAFCRDKRRNPEFFCWPGIWMTQHKVTAEIQSLFVTHLSLFQDRGDTERIFPRAIPGRSTESIKAFVNSFYASMLVFELALQWTLEPGEFRYDYKWLTGSFDNSEVTAFAKRQFQQFYGLDLDSFSLVDTPITSGASEGKAT
ncbi:hypothetical protein [Undibacterium rugosum]|uniref:hypothetical protein n=1 Tax=Undibacterium rugosum TaxID=2762291 RepID=UPI001B83327B|nr:hypothetical protein [Undibacterium rugosum]MBR7780252.1 hypothetical protein [Undibacterium rugosum]